MTTQEHQQAAAMLQTKWPSLWRRGLIALPETTREQQTIIERLKSHKPVQSGDKLRPPGMTATEYRSICRARLRAELAGEDTSMFPPRVRARRKTLKERLAT